MMQQPFKKVETLIGKCKKFEECSVEARRDKPSFRTLDAMRFCYLQRDISECWENEKAFPSHIRKTVEEILPL